MMYLVPVQPVGLFLIVQEAIVLVDNLPQCLEIALWGVSKLFLVYAGSTERQYTNGI